MPTAAAKYSRPAELTCVHSSASSTMREECILLTEARFDSAGAGNRENRGYPRFSLISHVVRMPWIPTDSGRLTSIRWNRTWSRPTIARETS